jgi:hydroxyacid-oxoacid transhydrogenase
VSIFDFTELHAKTGIASRRLKPTLGILDPENTRTMPRQVAASSGLDILSHAVESFTALPYTSRPRPASPARFGRPIRGRTPSATSGRFKR